MRETASLPIAQEFYLLMLFLFWFLGISLKMLDLKISGEKSLVWSECFSGSVSSSFFVISVSENVQLFPKRFCPINCSENKSVTTEFALGELQFCTRGSWSAAQTVEHARPWQPYVLLLQGAHTRPTTSTHDIMSHLHIPSTQGGGAKKKLLRWTVADECGLSIDNNFVPKTLLSIYEKK